MKKADYVLNPQAAQSGGEVAKEAVGNGPWGGVPGGATAFPPQF